MSACLKIVISWDAVGVSGSMEQDNRGWAYVEPIDLSPPSPSHSPITATYPTVI